MHRILVSDPIAEEGIQILRDAGEVKQVTGLGEAELADLIGAFDALVVRSATKVTRPVIEAAHKLQVIARAGVGVDNVDVAAATRRGILVVNSPAGNTMAATEHTIAMLLAAARMIPQGNQDIKAGRWDRKRFVGRQVSGKVLGIVGLGKVGSEVARRAGALGMKLLVYDPYVSSQQAESLGAELRDLGSLLPEADFVTIHAPLTPDTHHLIGAEQLDKLKPDAILINCARGGLVDEAALLDKLAAGELAGAALDVFEDEPTPSPELVGLPNVIATPHLGASTQEAQVNVAVDVARQVVDVLAGRPPRWPVNAPALPPEALAAIEPFIPLVRALGRLQHALWRAAIQRAELRCSADLAPEYLNILNHHFLVALLEAVITGSAGDCAVAGALIRESDPRIVNVDGFSLDLVPTGAVLLIWNSEPQRPGFVGKFGTLMGSAGVNIRGIQVAPEEIVGVGLMAVNLAQPIDQSLADQVMLLPGVERTVAVDFLNG